MRSGVGIFTEATTTGSKTGENFIEKYNSAGDFRKNGKTGDIILFLLCFFKST
jgi:hypothetical protein